MFVLHRTSAGCINQILRGDEGYEGDNSEFSATRPRILCNKNQNKPIKITNCKCLKNL